MDDPVPPANDPGRERRERILAISRTVHQVPVEEGGMLRRKPAAPVSPQPTADTAWRKAALVAGGLAALASGLAAGLWLRRRD